MTLSADVSTAQGLKTLDSFLSDKSYIEGYQASQADVSIFQNIKTAPTCATPHALRWHNHIKSYGNQLTSLPGEKKIVSPNRKEATKDEEDDDDVDLFGSDDEEDTEAIKVREQRLKEYAEKKSKKPILIAKSSIVLDVKPWDDETDMSEMEKQVRTIEMDGLVWGASKFVPVGYGINKLQIMCVVEDDKVSVDLLTEKIQDFEDFVQSVDIVVFNKV